MREQRRVLCSELHHPHIVQPKSLIRTPDFLCIVTEYANGGDLFRMVRRGGAHGLPVPAARFLFQQLILALEFCHSVDIYIRNINPSNLLIFWNDKGMPILKISDFHVAKDVRLQVRRPDMRGAAAAGHHSSCALLPDSDMCTKPALLLCGRTRTSAVI